MTSRGSVHIRHTSSRGASNTRVAAISRSLVVAALAAAMLLLLFFQFAEVVVEAIEALLPKLFVAIDPVGRVLQRRRLEGAAAPLRVVRAGAEAGALEDLEVLRHGGEAHVEWRGELGDGRLAGREAGQDRAPGRVGEGGEGVAELVVGHLTARLIN